MKCELYAKAFLDGILSVVGIVFLKWIMISEFTKSVEVESTFIIAGVIPVILALVYFIFTKKFLKNRLLLKFSLLSTAVFVINLLLLFIFQFSHIQLYEIKELNNGVGILIMFSFVIFTAIFVILRTAIFLIRFIQNKRGQDKGTV